MQILRVKILQRSGEIGEKVEMWMLSPGKINGEMGQKISERK